MSNELHTAGDQREAVSNIGLVAFARIGRQIVRLIQFAGGFGVLCIQILKELLYPPYYFRLIVEQIYILGTKSLFLVSLTAFAVGSVMALQFGFGLTKFGATPYIPKLVSLVMTREMGPVFTSLLLAGRLGSGIAAEIASMKVTQQIDAIRALGTSPIKRIVIPRVAAALIALPLLTLYADFIGLYGGLVVCEYELNINAEFYITKVIETVGMVDFVTGMLKAVVFALFISVTACWKGLTTTGGTRSIGDATTWVVVTSCIFIMIADYFLTKFFIITLYPAQG